MAADSCPDWLGACRRSAAAIADDARRPPDDRRARDRDRHARRGRRPHAARSTQAAEDVVFAELQNAARRGRAVHARSARSAGVVDFGDPTTLLVVIDPIDGSLNAKRGLPHYALSIAVADGPTMADVVFGFVQDFGPDGGVGRAGAARARSSTASPLDPSLGERRNRDGKLEVLGRRVRRPALGRAVRRRAGGDRAPAARDRRDRGLAVPGRGRPLRRDGVAEALPRGRRRGGAADRARGGRAVSRSSPTTTRWPRRWTSSRTRR